MNRIIYTSETRSFAVLDSIKDTAKSIGSSAKSSWSKGSFNRSNALFKAGDALSALNANKDLKAQIFGGRGKRVWYKPTTWLKGQKVKGMVNQAGETATAVTGNEKYQKGAAAASGLGKTAVGVGASIHTEATGMTHAKDGTRIIANAKKANEFGQKMDTKYREHLAAGGKDKFQGSSFTGDLVKKDMLRALDNQGVNVTGAAKARFDKDFAKGGGRGTQQFEQAKRNGFFKRAFTGREYDKGQSIGNQFLTNEEEAAGIKRVSSNPLDRSNWNKGTLQLYQEKRANDRARKDFYNQAGESINDYNKTHQYNPTTGKYVKIRSGNVVPNN